MKLRTAIKVLRIVNGWDKGKGSGRKWWRRVLRAERLGHRGARFQSAMTALNTVAKHGIKPGDLAR